MKRHFFALKSGFDLFRKVMLDNYHCENDDSLWLRNHSFILCSQAQWERLWPYSSLESRFVVKFE